MCRAENLAIAALERAVHFQVRRCPCCGWSGFRFRSFAVREYLRTDVVCPACGSFERHRALASFYPALFRRLGLRPHRLIHFAAEPCLAPTVAAFCDRYQTSAYANEDVADLHLDLIAIALPDESCDALLMNHVLDCIPNDRPAITEMFRVVRPKGVIVAVVALENDRPTQEHPVAGNGQYRVYGSADVAHRFAPFEVAIANAAEGLTPAARRRFSIPATIPVLVLRKT